SIALAFLCEGEFRLATTARRTKTRIKTPATIKGARTPGFGLAATGAGATAAAAPLEVEDTLSPFPHFRQNCESSGVSVPHLLQNIKDTPTKDCRLERDKRTH